MILLSVGFSKSNRDIFDKLRELCGFFKDRNTNIAIAESDVGNMHYIKCILRDTEGDIRAFDEGRDMFYSYAANAIYDFIANQYVGDILEKLLAENYNYLNCSDLEDVKQRCIAVITGTGIFSTEGLLYSINCKNNVIRKIVEYLHESSEMILDGFITFRLRDLNDEINRIVEKIVEDYIVEKEYSEFIKLLKYFVEIQESKYETVNIIIDCKGDYLIEDGNFNNITKDFFEDFNIDNLKGEVNKHDILISALITCAPKRIIVHGVSNLQDKEVMDTIKNIFLDKLSFCTGCEKCKSTMPVIKI